MSNSTRKYNFKPPVVRATPFAHAKAMCALNHFENEVCMFAVTSKDDPFLIEDIVIPPHEWGAASIEMDQDDISDFIEQMDTEHPDLEPKDFMRIWIHTHPQGVDNPSSTDWNNFREIMGGCSHSVMLIYVKGGGIICWVALTDPKTGVRVEQKANYFVDYESEYGPFLSEFVEEVTTNARESKWMGAKFNKWPSKNGTTQLTTSKNACPSGYGRFEDSYNELENDLDWGDTIVDAIEEEPQTWDEHFKAAVLWADAAGLDLNQMSDTEILEAYENAETQAYENFSRSVLMDD